MSVRLLPETKSLDRVPVGIWIRTGQVAKQPVSPPHHLQETTPRSMVLPAALQMLVEFLDPVRQDRYLDLGRPGVGITPTEIADDLALSFGRTTHGVHPLTCCFWHFISGNEDCTPLQTPCPRMNGCAAHMKWP